MTLRPSYPMALALALLTLTACDATDRNAAAPANTAEAPTSAAATNAAATPTAGRCTWLIEFVDARTFKTLAPAMRIDAPGRGTPGDWSCSQLPEGWRATPEGPQPPPGTEAATRLARAGKSATAQVSLLVR